jgi:predicted O-linked N-acetylglucosamine transferase (SPINDLY family)
MDIVQELKDINLEFDSGSYDSATQRIDSIITEYPDNIEPLIVGAQLASEIGEIERAKNLMTRCIALKSDDEEIWAFLIVILARSNQPKEVIDQCTKAIDLGFISNKILMPLCTAYRKSGKHNKALLILNKLENINNLNADGHYEMACCMQEANQGIDVAIKYCLKAIQIEQDHTNANMKFADLLMVAGQPDSALACHRRLLKSPKIHYDGSYLYTVSNILFTQNYSSKFSREEIYDEHNIFSENIGEVHIPSDKTNLSKSDIIHIGFVSADFNLHPVYHFLLPLLKHIDKSRFTISLFYNSINQFRDSATDILEKTVNNLHFIINKNDIELRDFIKSRNVDVLFDLSGHTASNRLGTFALRAAPLQIAWLGYPNTTGLKNMDYRVVDSVTDPFPEADALSTEKLIRLEGCFLCYNIRSSISDYNFSPNMNKPNIHFCCYNNPVKLTDDTISIWATILDQVSGSKLVLKSRFCMESETRAFIFDKYSNLGINKSQIILLNTTPCYKTHLESFNDIDIALDPFPYNGTTSTCEALFMGIPVITLEGDRHASRVSMSLLSSIGHLDLVAQETKEYISIAVSLSSDPQKLYDLKCQIRADMIKSSLMDGKKYASKFQNAIYSLIPD